MTDTHPLIFDIHRFALDDGPGIRTTVFFKGCPLSCFWCHNPEAISSEGEIAFHRHLCIGCGNCYEVCPTGAIRMDGDEPIKRDACTVCGTCADACPTRALRAVGRYFSAPELTEELLKDHLFYEFSKGGVTFSGGEPLIFIDYLAAVAERLKEQDIHIAIQTSGYFDFAEFMVKLYPVIDLVYFDIKLFDSCQHKRLTGKNNRLILENLRRFAGLTGVSVVPRIPLIPGITDTDKNLFKIGEFLGATGYRNCDLLPYNSAGIAKRNTLGKTVPNPLVGLKQDGSTGKRARDLLLKIFSDSKPPRNETDGAPALLSESH